MKRLSIIEDESNIRESLQLFIESKSHIEIESASERVEDFLKLSFKRKPEMMLLDIGLPGMSGIEGIPLIKKKYPEIDIVMLTTYEEDDVIFSALCAGACSYISKRTSLAKIVEALHIVESGGSYMSPSIAKKVTKYFMQKPVKNKSTLSDRQKEIVDHIINGKTYVEISELCFISINTVRSHIKKIYTTLNISSKVALIHKYMDGEI